MGAGASPTCACRAARRGRRRRRGDDVAMSARDQVTDLVPFVHVADVDRSVAFYERLGFVTEHEVAPEGRRIWAFLERGDARLIRGRRAGRPARAGGALLPLRA